MQTLPHSSIQPKTPFRWHLDCSFARPWTEDGAEPLSPQKRREDVCCFKLLSWWWFAVPEYSPKPPASPAPGTTGSHWPLPGGHAALPPLLRPSPPYDGARPCGAAPQGPLTSEFWSWKGSAKIFETHSWCGSLRRSSLTLGHISTFLGADFNILTKQWSTSDFRVTKSWFQISDLLFTSVRPWSMWSLPDPFAHL